MEFLYSTDLHGNVKGYETILNFAIIHNIKLIHLGADLLTKGSGILDIQKKFINGFLKEFYTQCQHKGIIALASFGNDDIYTRKSHFLKYGSLLDETPYQSEGFEFKAYNYVPIYPFSLRTACKLDSPGWVYTEDPVPTMDVDETGFIKIKDPDTYFKAKGTIQDDLKAFKGHDKLIMAIHTPPTGVSLDMCMDGRCVGSKAVYDWICDQQPLLVLSGHIHENLQITNIWQAKIGKTTVIQPGPNMVVIKIAQDNSINAHLINL